MQIIQSAIALLEAGEPFALATIVEQQGSTPRGIGTQMIIRPDGRIIGTLGGGSSEAQTIARGPDIIAQDTAYLLTVNMTGDDAAGSDMICGGIIRILIQSIQPRHLPTFQKLRIAETLRQKGLAGYPHGESDPCSGVCGRTKNNATRCPLCLIPCRAFAWTPPVLPCIRSKRQSLACMPGL